MAKSIHRDKTLEEWIEIVQRRTAARGIVWEARFARIVGGYYYNSGLNLGDVVDAIEMIAS